VALGVFALAAGSASAAAPKKNTITAVGGMKVKANAYVQDAQRWDADSYSVKSGDTVTLRDMETGEVGKEVVEAGSAGFDTGGDKTTAGDSVYLPPKGKVTFKVTAKKGTTLNFICAVHPWMVATIKVA
jgi:plastocyanin